MVEGVGHLLSQLAGCCKPVPGDEIEGYITQGRGVSVHRSDCEQLNKLLQQAPERAIEVHWAHQIRDRFQANVDVFCFDRSGILRDITTELANEKIGLLGVNSISDTQEQSAKISLHLEVPDLESLSRVITRLERVKGVVQVTRLIH